MDLRERFLKYVAFDTKSDENSEAGAPYGVSASLLSEKCVIGEIRSEFP